jgi:hypothetical protein
MVNRTDIIRRNEVTTMTRCDYDPPIHYDPIMDREGKMLSIIALLAVVGVLAVMMVVCDLGHWLYVVTG